MYKHYILKTGVMNTSNIYFTLELGFKNLLLLHEYL